jgi:hypothetical protein
MPFYRSGFLVAGQKVYGGPTATNDIAIELRPAKGDRDWAFGDFVFCHDEWKSELRHIVQGEVSLVGFRDDLMGRFDPRDSGIVLWTRSLPERSSDQH